MSEGNVDIRYKSAADPQVVVSMGYDALVAVADGRLRMDEFGANHVEVLAGEPAFVEELMNLLSGAVENMAP